MNPKFSIIDGHKYCSKCNAFLPIVAFDPNKNIKSGLSSWCINCTIKYRKHRYTPTGRSRGRPSKPKSPKSPKPTVPKGFKICSKCSILKEATNEVFCKTDLTKSGLSADCKECRYKQDKERRDKDPEKCKETQRKSYYKNIEKRKKSAKKWAQKNRKQINAKAREKRQQNPTIRIAENLRRAVNGCTKYNGFRKTSQLNQYLGCNSQEFKKYLESLFQPGMTWDNYGYGDDKWNMDHKIPLASATTVEELYVLNHYSNLQPLWQPDNLRKSDSLPSINLPININPIS